MRLLFKNLFAFTVLVGTEAWFLKGYFAGQPEFEPAIAFIAALGVLIAKDPLEARFAATGSSKSHDQTLFEEFLGALPAEPTIRLLKTQDFGNSFRQHEIDHLFEFAATWESVEREFLDAKLEKEKKELFALARELTYEISARTMPVGTNGYLSVLSDQQRASGQPRPSSVLEDARVLNGKASAFVQKYETFVRNCRGRIAP